MKTRMQNYRHSLSNGECMPPWGGIMVMQNMEKRAIHECYYCGRPMIPTPYYAITEGEEIKYYILDQEITKEEFYKWDSLDRAIDKQHESYYEKLNFPEDNKPNN